MRFEKSDQSKALSNRVVEIRVIDFLFLQQNKTKKKKKIDSITKSLHPFFKIVVEKKIPFPSSIDQSLLTYKVVDLSLTDD